LIISGLNAINLQVSKQSQSILYQSLVSLSQQYLSIYEHFHILNMYLSTNIADPNKIVDVTSYLLEQVDQWPIL